MVKKKRNIDHDHSRRCQKVQDNLKTVQLPAADIRHQHLLCLFLILFRLKLFPGEKIADTNIQFPAQILQKIHVGKGPPRFP